MKKKIFIAAVSIILLIGAGSFIISKNHTKNSDITELALSEDMSIKKSPYTLEEMYNLIRNWNLNDESLEIYENWYDYFSKDTPFINSMGVEWNYDEYKYLKEKFGKDFIYQVQVCGYGWWGENQQQ